MNAAAGGTTWLRRLKPPAAFGVFALALAVRLLYLYESSDNPTFNAPIVDAGGYDYRAHNLLEGKGVDEEFLTQPVLYPFFLAAVYRFTASSMLAVKIVQAFVGAITCALTCAIASRAFDRRSGLLAGLITTFYAPLIFFGGELLGEVWAAFWSVALVLLFGRASRSGRWAYGLAWGMCGALSVLTRPTFLPFFAATCVWLVVALRRNRHALHAIALQAVFVAVGFAVVVTPVGLLNRRVTGHFRFLPNYGGVNFYIGNNPDAELTVSVRPGPGFTRIAEMPQRAGITDVVEQDRYFYRLTAEYARTQPLAFLKGIGLKTLFFFHSQQIPRDSSTYVFRDWSWLLRLLMWKVGPFGFPFGVLLPLAVLGVAYGRRRIPFVLVLFLVLYPMANILVHVNDRYRDVTVPTMAVVAAAGAAGLYDRARSRRWAGVAGAAVASLGLVALFSLPRPYPRESLDYFRAEVFYFAGKYHAHRENRNDRAIECYRKAIRLRPDYADAHTGLGAALSESGRPDEAIQHFREATRLEPASAFARNNLGLLLYDTGRMSEAVFHLKKAVELDPAEPVAHNSLGLALLRDGQTDAAVVQFEEAVRLKPGFARARANLATALSVKGDYESAIRHFREALSALPDQALVHSGLAEALFKSGDIAAAIEAFTTACNLDPAWAEVRYNLAYALIRERRLREAAARLDEVIRLRHGFTSAKCVLAWILATAEEADVRDPARAITLAEQARGETRFEAPGILDALAAAYAAAGRFSEAVSTARSAIALAESAGNTKLASEIQGRLELYQAGQPCRKMPDFALRP